MRARGRRAGAHLKREAPPLRAARCCHSQPSAAPPPSRPRAPSACAFRSLSHPALRSAAALLGALRPPLCAALADASSSIALAGLELLAALAALAAPAADGGPEPPPPCAAALGALAAQTLPAALRLGASANAALQRPAFAACLGLLRACPPAAALPPVLAGCADSRPAHAPLRDLSLRLLAQLLQPEPAAEPAPPADHARPLPWPAPQQPACAAGQRARLAEAAQLLDEFWKGELVGAAGAQGEEPRAGVRDAFAGFARLWPERAAAIIARAEGAPDVRRAAQLAEAAAERGGARRPPCVTLPG